MIKGAFLSNFTSYENHLKFLRYSTAQRINKAADDPAGLAISEKSRAQYRGDDMAVRNMRDSQSLARTAEGALDQSHNVLQRMRELSIQANNGLLTDSDRGALQLEFNQLRETINAIGKDTQFNTKPLLDGSFTNQQTTTNGNGATLEMNINSAFASQLGHLETGRTIADIDLRANPSEALTIIDGAISQISHSRGNLGATENRLLHGINVTETQSLNIRDADMAKNAMELQKYKVMQQAYFLTQRMGMGMSGMNVNLFG